MRRRQFITLLGGVAAFAPVAARAQQSAIPKVGWLKSASPDSSPALPFFRQGLSELGSTVAEMIEIFVAGKYRVRVSSGVDAQALGRVLDVLERR
jgi:hypothetical protein